MATRPNPQALEVLMTRGSINMVTQVSAGPSVPSRRDRSPVRFSHLTPAYPKDRSVGTQTDYTVIQDLQALDPFQQKYSEVASTASNQPEGLATQAEAPPTTSSSTSETVSKRTRASHERHVPYDSCRYDKIRQVRDAHIKKIRQYWRVAADETLDLDVYPIVSNGKSKEEKWRRLRDMKDWSPTLLSAIENLAKATPNQRQQVEAMLLESVRGRAERKKPAGLRVADVNSVKRSLIVSKGGA